MEWIDTEKYIAEKCKYFGGFDYIREDDVYFLIELERKKLASQIREKLFSGESIRDILDFCENIVEE